MRGVAPRSLVVLVFSLRLSVVKSLLISWGLIMSVFVEGGDSVLGALLSVPTHQTGRRCGTPPGRRVEGDECVFVRGLNSVRCRHLFT